MTEPGDENPYAAHPHALTAAPHPSDSGADAAVGFRLVAVVVGLALDIGVFFLVVLIVALTVVEPAALGADPTVAFVEAFARPPVLVMLFAGLFLAHAGGGFAAGWIAGGRAGWHGLAVAIGFTAVTTLLSLGAEDAPASPIPDWLNVVELLARVPLAVVGCHAGVMRKRSRLR